MQGNSFFFAITDNAGRSWCINNGIVARSSVPRPLIYSPDGWTGIGIQNTRNSHYFALDRSLTVPLSFVEDGAAILKHIFYTYGVQGEANLVILAQKLSIDDTHYGFYYDSFYRGSVDFTTFNDSGFKVTVNILEGGIVDFVKSRENVTYQIRMDAGNPRLVIMDGMKLFQKATFIITNGTLPNNLGGHILSAPFVSIEAVSSVGAVNEDRIKTGNETAELWNTGSYFLLTGAAPTEITVNWDFDMLPHLDERVGPIFGTSIILQLHAISAADNRLINIPLQEIGGGDPLALYNQHHHFVGSTTLTIPERCRCILYMTATQNREFTNFIYGDNGSLTINYTYVHHTSLVKAHKPSYIFGEVVRQMTDGKYQGESPLLDQLDNLPLTTGDAIRGLPNTVLKTTLSDLFDFFNTTHDIGMGVKNNKLTIDLKENWINYDDFIDLGEVSKHSTMLSAEHTYSNLEIGYKEQQYDSVNAKNEVNNTHVYVTAITKINKKLSMISPYRVDPYGIEGIRINLEGKTTTDNAADDDIFCLHTAKKPIEYKQLITAYPLNRDLNASATGILDNVTIFNLYLSPKECFYRKGRFIHSLFYKMDDQLIKWQNSGKNANLAVVTAQRKIVEKSDVLTGDLPPRLFLPVVHEFEAPSPVALMDVLDQNALKCFRWTRNGIPFKGLPIKVAYEPEMTKVQTYQMLSAPDNDLEQLIEVKE